MASSREDTARPGGASGALNRFMQALAAPFVSVMQRWMPDPFIFATLLTALTFVLCVVIAEYPPASTVGAWGDGFWMLLTFTTQIAMTLLTGFALAYTPPVNRALNAMARLASAPPMAYMLVCFTAAVASLLSWGMGLVVGAIVARETANVCRKRGVTVHYPLLVASAYAGFVIWHMGLSSSVGLVIATEGHFLIDEIGIVPVSETLFSLSNIATIVVVMATLPVVMMLLRPGDADCIPIPAELAEEDEEARRMDATAGRPSYATPAAVLDNARIINLLIGGGGLVYLWFHFVERGESLNLNIVNFSFLVAGLLLSRSPLHYVQLITRGGRTLGPILLQYPFYAGIMGMMLDSGFAKIVAGWFSAIATADTLPFWAFVSGGLINLFVPSGGGQWAVQGPVMVEAAKNLGADIPRVAMGVAYGDQWTNMIQPMWTIPALAIVGLQVRDIMGYTVIALLWSGLLFTISLLFL